MMSKRYMTIDEKRAANAKPIRRALEALGPHSVTLLPNNMAAGPCAACLAIANRDWPAEFAPMPPFKDCSWPDQCACLWQIVPSSWEHEANISSGE